MSFHPDKLGVFQLDNTDCGLACLVSIHAFYGGQITVSQIRCLLKTEISGTTMLALAKTAQRLGYRAEGIKANTAYLKQMDTPMIAHMQQGEYMHYVVVYAFDSNSVRLMDPAVGRLQNRRLGVFLNQWTGYLLRIDRNSKPPGHPENCADRLAVQPSIRLDLEEPKLGWSKWLVIGKVHLGILGFIFYADFPPSSGVWMCFLAYFFAFELFVKGVQTQSLQALKRKELHWLKKSIKKMMRAPLHFFEGMSFDDLIKRLEDPSLCARYQEQRLLSLPLDLILVASLVCLLFIQDPHQFGSCILLLLMINVILTFSGITRRSAGTTSNSVYKECLSRLSFLQSVKGRPNFDWVHFWRILRHAEKSLFEKDTFRRERKQGAMLAVVQVFLLLLFSVLFFVFEVPWSFDLFQILVSFYVVLKLRAMATFFLFRTRFERSSKRLQEMLNFRWVE